MSFYYLFIPTWIFTTLVYTVLAGIYGAKKKYPEAEAIEKKYNEDVEHYQQEMAKKEPKLVKDTSILSKALKITAYTSLGVTLFLAAKVLFGSADEATYISNRETFYFYGFICTLLYFATAYWAMKRSETAKA